MIAGCGSTQSISSLLTPDEFNLAVTTITGDSTGTIYPATPRPRWPLSTAAGGEALALTGGLTWYGHNPSRPSWVPEMLDALQAIQAANLTPQSGGDIAITVASESGTTKPPDESEEGIEPVSLEDVSGDVWTQLIVSIVALGTTAVAYLYRRKIPFIGKKKADDAPLA